LSSWGYDSKVAENNANIAAKLEAQRAKYNSGSSKTSELGDQADSNKVGTTTSRGTKIVEYGDTGMGKNAFLNLLVAQMTNMDPTQDQDSTAYVTQMAQFASIEQMNNLNTTMTDFSVRNLLGKYVIVNQYDASGNPIEGKVMGVQTNAGKQYLSILDSNGELKDNIESSKVAGVIENISDNTSAISALNTQFIAASALKGQRVVIVDEDKDGNTIVIKGKVEGSYIDSGDVKLKINKFDDNLNETGDIEIYSYLDIYKAGDLSDEDMDVKASDFDEDKTESNNDSTENVSDE